MDLMNQLMFDEVSVNKSHASRSTGITFPIPAWVAMMQWPHSP